MGKVELEQGSPEWLAWRQGGIGGSDAAVIMGDNPWKTPYELWAEKTGRKDSDPVNAAMRRGTEMEPEARQAYVDYLGFNVEPACFQHDVYPALKASLDGLDKTGDLILEIKCPGEGTHVKALNGDVPQYYYVQMQHCMMVTGAKQAHYFSYRPEEHGSERALIIVDRDDAYIERLMAKELAFWRLVEEDTPPDTNPADYIINNDQWALKAAEEYAVALARYNAAKAQLDIAKEQLLEYTDDGNTVIGNLKLTRVVRQGSVDSKKLYARFGIDDHILDEFRKAETSYWKITEQK